MALAPQVIDLFICYYLFLLYLWTPICLGPLGVPVPSTLEPLYHLMEMTIMGHHGRHVCEEHRGA